MIDYKKILSSAPIKNRLDVINEMAFINLIYELGYKTEKWNKEDDEILAKLCDLAKEHTTHILEEYKQWEIDGKPTKE